MSTKSDPKSAPPPRARQPDKKTGTDKPKTAPPKGALLPDNIPAAERVERENDLA